MFKDMDVKVLIRSSRFLEQKKYWMQKLSGDLVKTGILPINSDTPEPEPRKEKQEIFLPDDLCEKISKLGKESDLSIYIILLSALKALIFRYEKSHDITVITPIYRQKISPETINSCLFIRDQLTGSISFKELLIRVRKSVLDAHESQDYPYGEIIGNLLDSPRQQFNISTIFCSFKPVHPELKLKKIDVKLSFIFEKPGEKINGHILFDPYTYSGEFIEHLSGHFSRMLANLIENKNKKISHISFLSKEEVEQLIYAFNNNRADFSKDKTIYQYVEERAVCTPANIALSCKDHHLTYRELNLKVNQMAGVLIESGIQKDRLVGILLDRSPGMAVSIMATWKAGGAYIPLDTKYPANRIISILQDSNVSVLITREEYFRPDFQGFYREEILMLDTEWDNHRIAQQSTGNSDLDVEMNSLAYVIYTSGSTGKPKGVMVEHLGMMNHIGAKINHLQITGESIIAQNASQMFDISVWQFFTAFITGGKTIIYPNEIILDPGYFLLKLITDKVTILEVVPGYLSVILDITGLNFRPFQHLHYLLVTGETLKKKPVKRWFEQYPHIKMVNAYGPTEASDDITHFIMEKAPDINMISIGKPIQNIHIYILDENMTLCPIGVKGEICVSGVCVGRGYLNKPEKSQEVFPLDPFMAKKAIRLFKTGDSGRWLPDGTIEFFGRKDYQVKIRGYRIELGEIENRLIDHPDIKDAVVINKEDMTGNEFLCAYLVKSKELKIPGIKEYLSENLSDYMVPAYFIEMDKLPLTPNGKVDRHSLPEPWQKVNNYIAPGNKTQCHLVDIWREILGVDKSIIGIESNFFELGGHSLKAMTLASRIHNQFNVKMPLVEIFKTPTIKGISGYILEANKEKYVAVRAVEKKEYYALSSAQKRLYILQQMDLNGIGYNMPAIMVAEGPIIKEKLENTARKLILRHETLRTSFVLVGDIPGQKVHEPPLDFSIEYYNDDNRSGGQSPGKGIPKKFVRAFDLSAVPLVRMAVAKIEQTRQILMFDMHHIISDGISLDILVNDFLKLYHKEELAALRLQYKDYSEWQNKSGEDEKESLERQEKYWLNKFNDNTPVLNIPTDFPRPRLKSFAGSLIKFNLEGRQKRALEKIAAESGATLYLVLLTIFNILLYKLSGQGDIVIGTLMAGRQKADLEPIIGMFVNTLPLRNQPDDSKTFATLLEEVKQEFLQTHENQDYQFEDLVRQLSVQGDFSHNPIFDVIFSYEKIDTKSADQRLANSPDLKLKPYDYVSLIAKFDLNLNVVESDEMLHLSFEYCTKLFKDNTIQRFVLYLNRILSAIISDSTRLISGINILSEEDRKQLLETFHNNRVPYAREKTLPGLFEAQVEKSPDKIALEFEERAITYQELNQRANRLARLSRKKGLTRDSIAGILAIRSVSVIIGILGILKAGGAYLPIDPDYPGKRIDYMLADSGATLFITGETGSYTSIQTIQTCKCKMMDLSEVGLFTGVEENPENINKSSDLAYVIYTSGSTGKPRGVMVEHRNVHNLVIGLKERIYKHTGSRLKVALVAPLVFDASVQQVFAALLLGYGLCIMPDIYRMDGNGLYEFYGKYGIDVSDGTPTHINILLDSSPGNNSAGPGVRYFIMPGVRYFIIGGEALPQQVAMKFIKRFEAPGSRIINVYGPTECCVDSTSYWLSPGDLAAYKSVPIGTPMPNEQIHIVDSIGHLQAIGIPGELCIAGHGVSRGYLNKPGLTAEKFRRVFPGSSSFAVSSPDRLSKTPNNQCCIAGDRLYYTGDLARWLEDGNIEFLGRIDQQVKIRGFRIEPGEIENRLMKHSEIKNAVVITRKDQRRGEYLCAYYVSDNELEASVLREFLSHELPDYMVPSFFVQLESISLTTNGKINKNLLPEPEIRQDNNFIAPRNQVECKIAEVWQEVLGLETVGIHDNFFSLGGNSLLSIKVAGHLQRVMQREVPVVAVFRHLTVHSLAKYLGSDDQAKQDHGPVRDWSREFNAGKNRMRKAINRMTGVKSEKINGNARKKRIYETGKQ